MNLPKPLSSSPLLSLAVGLWLLLSLFVHIAMAWASATMLSLLAAWGLSGLVLAGACILISIKTRDHSVLLLAGAMVILFFSSPLLWWLGEYLRARLQA